jgi:DNA-binding transcriptional ArsR family regulator
VGKALSSPKRLEILKMLAQDEKAVETIINVAPYGNEGACNAMRLAAAVAGKEGQKPGPLITAQRLPAS